MKSLEDVQVVSSLKDALNFAESWNIQNNLKNEIVILGGGEVFNQTTNIVNKLVITRVDCDIMGDVFYPKIDLREWKIIDDVTAIVQQRQHQCQQKPYNDTRSRTRKTLER